MLTITHPSIYGKRKIQTSTEARELENRFCIVKCMMCLFSKVNPHLYICYCKIYRKFEIRSNILGECDKLK